MHREQQLHTADTRISYLKVGVQTGFRYDYELNSLTSYGLSITHNRGEFIHV